MSDLLERLAMKAADVLRVALKHLQERAKAEFDPSPAQRLRARHTRRALLESLSAWVHLIEEDEHEQQVAEKGPPKA